MSVEYVGLTPEQRYMQALQKVRIVAQRELKLFLADKLDILPAHKNREFLIQEIGRAYRAGFAAGRAAS